MADGQNSRQDKNGHTRGAPRRRHALPLVCYLLALVQATVGIGCGQDRIQGGGVGASSTVAGVLASHDLGEVAFQLYRERVAAEAPGAPRDARLAALDARRADFVAAINDVVNVRTLQGVGQTADALYALIDDGTLPTLTDRFSDLLEQLEQDPRAIDGVLRLLRQQKDAIPVDVLIALLGRMFNYDETGELWTAAAQLIDENDGRDAAGNPNGEPTLVPDLLRLVSERLARYAASGQSGQAGRLGQALEQMGRALTEEAAIRGTIDFGAPEWVVRIDRRGRPQVATNPATGRLYPPFEDGDGDGLADVDPAGRFVDAQGQPISIPTFGRPGDPGYDGSGRATAGSGDLLYVYVDAKRTLLALYFKLFGDALARDVDRNACLVLEAALGPVQADGTYGQDNPVADLSWAALEQLEPDCAPTALRATAALLEQDPARAEQLIVRVARAIEACRQAKQSSPNASLRLSDPRMVQLMDDMLPLADDLCETRGQGTSTARTLIDTLAQLRHRAPDFAHQVAPLFVMRQVEREAAPDADRNAIDEARSLRVDYALPAGLDNRSAVQQLLDLLARADGCTLFGESLAVRIIDIMADQSPQTVGSLVTLVQAVPGFMTNLVCSGISQDIAALDALARSGALDAFLPLAKTFKDRGDTRLLVQLLVRLQRDYAQTVRPFEQDLALILESGAVDELMVVVDEARTVTDPVSGQSVADALARAVEQLVDDDLTLVDRRGRQVRSRAQMLLQPLFELDRRLGAAGRDAEAGALVSELLQLFLARTTVNGQEVLQNGSLIPLAAKSLRLFADALPQDAATRAAEVDRGQQAVSELLTSKDPATVLTLLRVIDAAPSKALIRRGLVNLLTPNRPTGHDIFGAAARLAVIVLQSPPDLGALDDLAPFLSRVLDPASPLVPDAVRAFERLLTADRGQTVLNLLRAALNPAPGELDPPALVLVQVVQEVEDAGGAAGGAALDRAAVTAFLGDLIGFLRDDQRGLGYIYELIRNRQR